MVGDSRGRPVGRGGVRGGGGRGGSGGRANLNAPACRKYLVAAGGQMGQSGCVGSLRGPLRLWEPLSTYLTRPPFCLGPLLLHRWQPFHIRVHPNPLHYWPQTWLNPIQQFLPPPPSPRLCQLRHS